MKNPTRRSFIQGGVAAALGSSLPAPAIIRRAKKKNVLFIGVDDLATQLGCYGRPVQTPHIDRLASRGVRFNSAYCQYPWCSPSRSSLLTGLSPDTTRIYDLKTHFRKNIPNVVTLPQLFKQNGYYSARVGKIFHAGNPDQEGTDGLDDPISWDWTFDPAGIDHYKDEKLVTNFTPGVPLGAAIAFYRSKAPDREITDGIGASKVIEILRQKRSQPIFLAYGLYRPHVPWIVPENDFERYPLHSIQTYPLTPEELTMAPPTAYRTRPPNYGMTHHQQQQAIQGYYASTTFVDRQVGRVLHELEQSGLAEDTLVVFWADHGWQLGQHGQWEKQTLFEAAARVPMIFAGAGVPANGKVCSRTVEHLDLYPTIASLCGLSDVPTNLQGESFVPLLQNPDAAWSKPAVTQILRTKRDVSPGTRGYSIRNQRYRYTMWNDGYVGEELYDYVSDPRETRNLAHDHNLHRIKFQLRTNLNDITLARGRRPV